MNHSLRIPFATALVFTLGAAAQTPALVKDISAGTTGSNCARMCAAGTNTIFFNANGGTGNDLWKSDGTTAGTVLVKDIPTSLSCPDEFTYVDGTVFFVASDDALYGRELWKSDGTSAGTFMVKDIVPGATGSNPEKMWDVNGILVLKVDDGVNGEELWKSDGSAAGTTLLKDINPGSDDADLSNLRRDYALMNGYLYFQASEPVNGDELWRTDGTTAGTTLVKDIRTGSDGSGPKSLTNVNGTLFFLANDGTGNRGLWKSDGTAAGTVFVSTFPSFSFEVTGLTNVNGTLFMIVPDEFTNGVELWKSDGTPAGTVMVKDINPGVADANPGLLTNMNGILFFTANDGANGTELWRSDGTSAGTVLVKDIAPGAAGIVATEMVTVNGVLFFDAWESVYGIELWRSDGTETGTTLTLDIFPGFQVSSPNDLTVAGSSLFFSATDPTHGLELWSVQNVDVGIATIAAIEQISVFPNPADEHIRVQLPWAGASEVFVYDQLGAMVRSLRVQDITPEIDVRDLTPGVYVARISNARGLATARFVVRH